MDASIQRDIVVRFEDVLVSTVRNIASASASASSSTSSSSTITTIAPSKPQRMIQRIKRRFPNFCCGINELAKRLERDELRLLVVLRESDQPTIMLEHLLWMAAKNQIPVCVLQQSQAKLKELLELKSVVTFGFTRNTPKSDQQSSTTATTTSSSSSSASSTSISGIGTAAVSSAISAKEQQIIARENDELERFIAFVAQHSTRIPKPWMMRGEKPTLMETNTTFTGQKRTREQAAPTTTAEEEQQ
jgi:ribosomal protein L7Ae-like RNA K-turn-binding protein